MLRAWVGIHQETRRCIQDVGTRGCPRARGQLLAACCAPIGSSLWSRVGESVAITRIGGDEDFSRTGVRFKHYGQSLSTAPFP